MSFELKSGASTDKLTVDPTSKAARATLYDASGNPIGTGQSNPLYVAAMDLHSLPGWVGTYGASSFRMVGAVATAQVLMTVRNNGGSLGIAIRRLFVGTSVSAAAAFLTQHYFRWWLNTGTTPSGGSAPTKFKARSDYPSSQAATEILFASSADGTAAAITHATPGSNPARQQVHVNQQTAVGDAGNAVEAELITPEGHPHFVLSGETAALILIGSASNIATNHYTVDVAWEEFTP